METKNNKFSKLISVIFATDSEIQVVAFNILAFCGIVVSIITAIVNGIRLSSAVFPDIAGALGSIVLMYYCHKTGNYKRAMILTVFLIFMGLFTFLYFLQGGYHGGIPSFFIFGVVFTAFLLDGISMVVLIFIELAWYISLILYSYYHPMTLNNDERFYMTCVIMDMTLVALSLAVTMYFQIHVYRKKQHQLNAAIKEAGEANRAKSDFIAKMSHDVRTPLNTILAMNELIVNNTSSERIREWVNDSNISGQVLLSMIDDMLYLSRIKAGRVAIVTRPWNTRSVFDETARVWKLNAAKAGLGFIYEMEDDIPVYLNGDEGVIRKIMDNLLSNAVKYTKKGNITLSVKQDDMLEIIVEDTGVGIAPDYIDDIFSPYERGVEEVYKETSGSGLGLTIVKELVEAMGGTIKCDSILEKGSIFTVRIPQKEVSVIDVHADEKKMPPEIRKSKQFVAPNAHILVVDDNAYNRKVIREFTQPALIQLDDVESGYEAIEMIDIKKYDLVVMDIRMPHMDGMQTLARIKEEYPDFDTPVVALTGDIMNGVEEKLMSLGFSGFLAKPVSLSKFLNTVKEFIPDKIVEIDAVEEPELVPEKLESGQSFLIPFGIDLKMALEYCAGNPNEFAMRTELFEEFADANIARLNEKPVTDDYYLLIHSIKSVAKGIGAYLLAGLAEAAERRRDDAFSEEVNPLIIAEYGRVREGIRRYKEEFSAK
ncbi:MAG: response regulator [Lachnospiraceae bacterium]|nr:response regulator [Lachnospiraceae bacterium]